MMTFLFTTLLTTAAPVRLTERPNSAQEWRKNLNVLRASKSIGTILKSQGITTRGPGRI